MVAALRGLAICESLQRRMTSEAKNCLDRPSRGAQKLHLEKSPICEILQKKITPKYCSLLVSEIVFSITCFRAVVTRVVVKLVVQRV